MRAGFSGPAPSGASAQLLCAHAVRRRRQQFPAIASLYEFQRLLADAPGASFSSVIGGGVAAAGDDEAEQAVARSAQQRSGGVADDAAAGRDETDAAYCRADRCRTSCAIVVDIRL